MRPWAAVSVRQALGRKQPAEQGYGFCYTIDAYARRLVAQTGSYVLRFHVAAADAQLEPAIREQVERCGLLGEQGQRVMGHSQAVHDRTGPKIAGRGEGHGLDQADLFEAEPQCFPSRLGGVSVSPIIPGEALTHLDCRREVGFECGNAQAHEPDEHSLFHQFDRPESELVD